MADIKRIGGNRKNQRIDNQTRWNDEDLKFVQKKFDFRKLKINWTNRGPLNIKKKHFRDSSSKESRSKHLWRQFKEFWKSNKSLEWKTRGSIKEISINFLNTWQF